MGTWNFWFVLAWVACLRLTLLSNFHHSHVPVKTTHSINIKYSLWLFAMPLGLSGDPKHLTVYLILHTKKTFWCSYIEVWSLTVLNLVEKIRNMLWKVFLDRGDKWVLTNDVDRYALGFQGRWNQWWVQQSKKYSLRMWNLFNACISPSVFILFPHDSLPPVFPIFWMLKPWCLHLSILFAAASPTPGHCLAHHGCTKNFYQKRIAHDIWGERNLGATPLLDEA